MSEDNIQESSGLTDAEREELEQLRAEKAALKKHLQAQQDARDKAELERLRAEKKRAEDAAQLYNNDDIDELPPMGRKQKIIIAVSAILIVVLAFYIARVYGVF